MLVLLTTLFHAKKVLIVNMEIQVFGILPDELNDEITHFENNHTKIDLNEISDEDEYRLY